MFRDQTRSRMQIIKPRSVRNGNHPAQQDPLPLSGGGLGRG